MHTIKLEISDSLYDKVMFFLQQLPKTEIKLHQPRTKEKKDLSELLNIGTFDIDEVRVKNWNIEEF